MLILAALATAAHLCASATTRWRASSPQFRRRRVDETAFVAQPVRSVAREQERAVEISQARALRKQHRRRHGERGCHHAADHELEAEPLGLLRHGERLGKSAGLVELDVDRVIFAHERGKRGAVEIEKLGPEAIDKLWLRNVRTDPAEYLRARFAAESSLRKSAEPAR